MSVVRNRPAGDLPPWLIPTIRIIVTSFRIEAALISGFGQDRRGQPCQDLLAADRPHVGAGAVLSMLVPVAVFISLQRYFVRGLTAGSVKG